MKKKKKATKKYNYMYAKGSQLTVDVFLKEQ